MPEFDCPECDRKLKSKSALTLHIKSAHSGEGGVGVMTSLAAKYGAAAPRPGGGWRPDRPLRAAPSGIPTIDSIIGIGGLPRGCIVEIFGPPSSGKTNVALAFSAYTQRHGGLAGYEDAEHRFQVTMAQLVPGLNLDTLYYSEPSKEGGGEEALEICRDYVGTGLFDVWTVDSVHGCVPASLRNQAFGKATMAELAKLMSVACQVLDYIVAETNTVLIFVNHVKAVPGVVYGKEWSKPGGSALDYYSSVQLRVQPVAIFQDEKKRKIGQTVRVRVENSKVAAPFAEGTYDLYLAEGKIKKAAKDGKKDPHDGMYVTPGIDIGSCWFSVCKENNILAYRGNAWANVDTGESYGSEREMYEMLEDSNFGPRKVAENLVYGEYANNTKSSVESKIESDNASVTLPTFVSSPMAIPDSEPEEPDDDEATEEGQAKLDALLAGMDT